MCALRPAQRKGTPVLEGPSGMFKGKRLELSSRVCRKAKNHFGPALNLSADARAPGSRSGEAFD